MKGGKPVVEDAATIRAQLASDRPGEYHFGDSYDYVKFTAGLLRQSRIKYKTVADAGGMCASTASKLAHNQTRFPRFSTIAGVLGALGYETVIRGGPVVKEKKR